MYRPRSDYLTLGSLRLLNVLRKDEWKEYLFERLDYITRPIPAPQMTPAAPAKTTIADVVLVDSSPTIPKKRPMSYSSDLLEPAPPSIAQKTLSSNPKILSS